MPKAKAKEQPPVNSDAEDQRIVRLMDHYNKASQEMDTRRTRKNGWNEGYSAYMNKLPPNWPYNAVVTDPRIRNTVIEKTARLLNSKLQGRLVPREGNDTLGARINNAILDFQWDRADENGPMVEKVAKADSDARIVGASFTYVYWDNSKECNEIKPIDPRDILLDFSADHIRNAKWVQIREFTTKEQLEARGFDVSDIEFSTTLPRSSIYDSIVKANRGLTDQIGNDLTFPVVEVVTEWQAAVGKTKGREIVFLPKQKRILRDRENPYKHGRIPIAQLRYYPLTDDIYGESEIEPVLPLQRAINAILCGFIDTMNNAIKPPLKIIANQVRRETIEYGPGAQWIVNSQGAVEEAKVGEAAIAQFNATYPALVAAFNTAMGDQSLGISNIKGYQTDKTATEVDSLKQQQNTRDQYNQLYLAQYLKEIMLMWLANNQQYLFDDPTKKYFILKIIGKDKIKELQQFGLDTMDIPPQALSGAADAIMQSPAAMEPGFMQTALEAVRMPVNPVVLNPNDNPENYQVEQKMKMLNENEAELYVTPGDLVGVFDYIPDVKSMAAGAGAEMQKGRREAFEMALNPQVVQMLQMQGETFNMKELLVTILEDAGIKDAQSLFDRGNVPAGQPLTPTGGGAVPTNGNPGVPAGAPAISAGTSTGGIPQSAQALPYGPGLQ